MIYNINIKSLKSVYNWDTNKTGVYSVCENYAYNGMVVGNMWVIHGWQFIIDDGCMFEIKYESE